MGWTFFYLMVILKIPIIALLYVVWWAIHQTDEDEVEVGGDDGGQRPHHPRDPRPRPPRRGPHADPPPASPPRSRTPATARIERTPEHD